MNQHLPPPVLDAGPGAETAAEALWVAWATSGSPDVAEKAWLALQCTLLPEVSRGVLVLGAPDTGPYAPVAVWPEGHAATEEMAEVAGECLAQRRPVIVNRASGSLVACPIAMDGQLHGIVAIESAGQGDPVLQNLVEQLRWGCLVLESALRREQTLEEQKTRERLIATLDMVASVLAEDGFEAAAQTLATDLAIRLDCDRVSIGLLRDLNAKVVAVSHSADFSSRMNLIRAIGTAMDEALDQKSIIAFPGSTDEVLVTRDHAALARHFGSDAVLTVPFAIDEQTSGAFTFERAGNNAFDAATIELCQAIVALGSRILVAKRLNERLLVARIKDSGEAELRKLLGPRHFGRKLAAATLMFFALFFSFATGEHRIAANASLEGAVRRVLVAPFDGYVATASHRAGDVVAAGTVLATLDDKDLRLEYYKWTSQRAQYSKQYQEFMAQHDRAQGNITLAQVQQADAQTNLLAEQLTRTQITAPFPGIVVSGDLHQALGSAVRRGQVLFEVTPLNAYRVILEVEEGDITAIIAKQRGQLSLTALPGEVFPFTVTHVTPVAVAREGRSFFRVEALLERHSERLRPGMDGVAKVDAGRARLFWIWTHKFFDWLRLSLWAWF